MKLEYRIKGKVQKSFILRGLTFRIGEDIDFVVYGNELDFVKERCSISELKDLNKKVEPTPEPILQEKTDTIEEIKESKEAKDVKLQSTTRTSKTNNKRQI